MEKISWAPKIRQSKIWQLYQNDARGAVDEVLVEDVGLGLLQRCHSIWLITNRKVECPRCGTQIPMCETDSWKHLTGVQRCPTSSCGWETTAEQWHESWRHRELLGTAAMAAIETYLSDYPRAQTTGEKMVCIDQLIHSFHISLRTGKTTRSFANNLIEGSHDQVVELLDRLFEKPAVRRKCSGARRSMACTSGAGRRNKWVSRELFSLSPSLNSGRNGNIL